MRILEKYIVGRLLKSFFFLALNFFLLYLIISLLSDLQDILKANLNIKDLLAGYIFNSVTISEKMLTFAFLIASLHLIGTLNYHNEITAMRTEGIGIMNLSRMFITTAILVSLFCLFIDNNIVPLLRENRSFAYQSKLKAQTPKKTIENFAYYSQDGYFIFARKFDVGKNKMEGVNIFKENGKGQLEEEIIAPQLFWYNRKWHLQNSTHYRLAGNDFILQSSSEEELLSLAESPSKLATHTAQSWQYLSLKELRRSIKSFSRWKSSKIANILKLEFHKKIAFSFSPFFLLLAALPFALQIKTRRAGLSSLGTAIIFYFLYYVLSSLSLALGKIDFFPPSIAAWLTNIFFGISGLVGLMSLQ